MEIIGKIKKVLDLIQGETEAGPWCRREVVITPTGDNGKDVCVSFFGERHVRKLESLHEGDLVQVQAAVRSRETTAGRWFTSIEGSSINKLQKEPTAQVEAPDMPADMFDVFHNPPVD